MILHGVNPAVESAATNTLDPTRIVSAGKALLRIPTVNEPVSAFTTNFTSNDPADSATFTPAVDAGWTGRSETRYRSLSRAEALGTITLEETLELEDLTELRRITINPPTADEILWQRKQKKVTRTLLEALDAYAEFHNS